VGGLQAVGLVDGVALCGAAARYRPGRVLLAAAALGDGDGVGDVAGVGRLAAVGDVDDRLVGQSVLGVEALLLGDVAEVGEVTDDLVGRESGDVVPPELQHRGLDVGRAGEHGRTPEVVDGQPRPRHAGLRQP